MARLPYFLKRAELQSSPPGGVGRRSTSAGRCPHPDKIPTRWRLSTQLQPFTGFPPIPESCHSWGASTVRSARIAARGWSCLDRQHRLRSLARLSRRRERQAWTSGARNRVRLRCQCRARLDDLHGGFDKHRSLTAGSYRPQNRSHGATVSFHYCGHLNEC